MIKSWILKLVLHMVAGGLEMRFPGLKPLIEAILSFLENGGSAAAVHEHLNSTMPDFFSPEGIKKD